jgi:hypothetical protein
MLAFYGILGLNLGQQAQSCRQTIVQSLGNVDSSVKGFSYIVEPLLTPESNWSIPFDIERNTGMILKKESWQTSPAEVLNPIVECILGNFTKAEQMDNEVKDWLQSMNVTRFRTHYLEVIYSLHDLIEGIYREFPPPPAQFDKWNVISFVNHTFPEGENTFRDWAERYEYYHSGISEIRSRISEALAGISEAYLDDSKMDSQTLEMLIRENRTDYWTTRSFQNMIRYNIAFASYYQSIFDSLASINSQVVSIVVNMERYHRIYSLAFIDIVAPVVMMILSGVVIPMSLLGASEYIDRHRMSGFSFEKTERNGKIAFKIRRRCWGLYIYLAVVLVSIILFVISVYWATSVLWRQISELYLS